MRYGAKLSKGVLYATADNALFRRNEYLAIALAPLVGITLVVMVLMVVAPQGLAYYARDRGGAQRGRGGGRSVVGGRPAALSAAACWSATKPTASASTRPARSGSSTQNSEPPPPR